MRVLNGGWSYTWQGERTDEFTQDHNTILEALQAKIGKKQVIFEEGVIYPKDATYEVDEVEKSERN